MSQPASPQIDHVAWGEIEARGLPAAKDLKLFPGGGRAWDWRETGTRHSPGIQPADVDELVERGCTAVILSRGMDLVLQTQAETLTHLAARGIAVEVLETRLAVARYNELAAAGVAVGGLFHSTC